MAKNMVRTYLHLLDPEIPIEIVESDHIFFMATWRCLGWEDIPEPEAIPSMRWKQFKPWNISLGPIRKDWLRSNYVGFIP